MYLVCVVLYIVSFLFNILNFVIDIYFINHATIKASEDVRQLVGLSFLLSFCISCVFLYIELTSWREYSHEYSHHTDQVISLTVFNGICTNLLEDSLVLFFAIKYFSNVFLTRKFVSFLSFSGQIYIRSLFSIHHVYIYIIYIVFALFLSTLSVIGTIVKFIMFYATKKREAQHNRRNSNNPNFVQSHRSNVIRPMAAIPDEGIIAH